MPIRLIVGLGNPGPEYEQTRHNAGFWLVDNLANSLPGTRLQRDSRYNAMLAKTSIAGKEVWLLEPLTFMNRSGQSVGALARWGRSWFVAAATGFAAVFVLGVAMVSPGGYRAFSKAPSGEGAGAENSAIRQRCHPRRRPVARSRSRRQHGLRRRT